MQNKFEFNFKDYYLYCIENNLKPGIFSSLKSFKNACEV